jgi:putative ABC transport system ATP-binding protein
MRSSKLLAAFGSRAAETGLVRSIVTGSHRTVQITPSQTFTKILNARQLRSFASKPAPDASLLRSASRSTAPTYQAVTRSSILSQVRCLSVSQKLNNAQPPAPQPQKENRDVTRVNENKDEGFELSEKAAQAAQINLTAKLGRDGKEKGKKPAFNEIWRLLKIARPEAKSLGLAFFFLLISSSITMSIPFSIGKIMDLATKGEEAEGLFGMSMPMFYGALAGIICVGAAANYGRIIILRIVGERVVARQRSKLFRRTFVQDAEFFDANRVGDLISRLSSDTLIVGKSITQNLSDGLRSIVSCTAGFGAMAYVSLKLSSVLALLLPPIGVAAFFYGRTIRNLSRKIQKNLGTLTKIAEERLGNVKTSQAFAAEVSEVGRYNNQVKKIFELGRRESLISASFFSSVSLLQRYYVPACANGVTDRPYGQHDNSHTLVCGWWSSPIRWNHSWRTYFFPHVYCLCWIQSLWTFELLL